MFETTDIVLIEINKYTFECYMRHAGQVVTRWCETRKRLSMSRPLREDRPNPTR